MKTFFDWMNIREGLRTHQERDPFARQTLVGKPVDANGKTCSECGSQPKNGKLYKYTIETDGGRKQDVRGLFCCKSCMKSYNA